MIFCSAKFTKRRAVGEHKGGKIKNYLPVGRIILFMKKEALKCNI